MRARFEPQISLGTVDIEDIELDMTSRHELTPILAALQYLYAHHRDQLYQILELIEKDVSKGKSTKLGCKGMTYWEILVLAVIRLGCDKDYDDLADTATYHSLVQRILQISEWNPKKYARSTIQENLERLSPEAINTISDIIIKIGHSLSDANPLDKVRGDTWVVEKNIHYPTDTNILYDGLRKIIEYCVRIAEEYGIKGWQQHGHWMRKIKKLLKKISKTGRSRSPKRDEKLKELYFEFLEAAEMIINKAVFTISSLDQIAGKQLSEFWKGYVSELHYFIAGSEYICELARRRIIKGETLPHADKVFSLFEPGTEMINRGKTPYPYQFGHRVLIIQDNAGFIIHNCVLGQGFTDEKIITEVMRNLQKKYDGAIIAASFDKGFWTPANLKELSEFIRLVVLPKKGKLSETDKIRESSKEFGEVRKWHPGVESAIHALIAGNGLKVCRDKGPTGYKRYIATAILARNLQTLGNIIIKNRRKEEDADDPLMQLIV